MRLNMLVGGGCALFTLVCQGAGPVKAERSALTTPILFCKRFNYQGLHIYDTFYQWRPGGGLYVLENPADPPERHRVRPVIDPTTPETLGEGIYFDPALSYDAQRVLFSFKGSPDGNSTLYEIRLDLAATAHAVGRDLRQVTNLDGAGIPYKGSGGGHHDVQPWYLPDGRIVFTSTRYGGLVPCANNGVAILHVMNADGTGLHTISVNNVTDFDPSVLPDGRILFSRWEYIDRNALVIQSLWTVLPDGRNETELFANHLVFPEAVLQAKPVPGHDGLVVATFAPHNAPPRGAIAMIDTRVGKNDISAIFNFEFPDNPTHDRGESCDPWPLSDQVVLYSGVPPEPDAPAIEIETPGFRRRSNPKLNALMLIDRAGRRATVHSDPEIDLHNPIPIAPRPLPRIQPDMTDRAQRTGTFFVHDVYRSMPEVPRGTIKWLRVLEETSRVSASPGGTWMNQTFSISAALAWSAKIYHGIVPVEPDGSVFFEAPSGRAIFFQLLDQDYRLARGMRTFIQASPGVTRSCVGCHEYNPRATGGSRMSARSQPRPLRPESWGSGYIDYPTMIQPILTARCVTCHGGEKGMAAGLDLSGGATEFFNISYEHLTARRERMHTADLIGGICAMNGTAHWSVRVFGPYSHGSGKAPLADILLSESHRDLLTQTERELLFAWMDSNGIYFGTWDYTAAGPRSGAFLDGVARIKGVMKEAGCARCHANDKGEIRRFDQWINLEQPEMSLVLRAPLPKSQSAQGGYGLALCRNRPVDPTFSRKGLIYGFGYAHAVQDLDSFPTQSWPRAWPSEGEPVISFASTDDPHYRKMLGIIRDARDRQRAEPRIDMPWAEFVGVGVMEGRSRQILPQPLPDPLPEATAALDENGFVRISWEASARTIGLITEIHRGPDATFLPDGSTLIGRTSRFTFVDRGAPAGDAHYAVVFVSDPAGTCGIARLGATTAAPDVNEGQAKAVAALPSATRCLLAVVAPQRSAPVRARIEAPAELPALRVDGLEAASRAGGVMLRWTPVGPPGIIAYDVYGERTGAGRERLTSNPISDTRFTDTLFHGGMEARYAVVARAPRRAEPQWPEPDRWVSARPLPLPQAPVMTLGSETPGISLRDGAQWKEGMLSLPGRGYAALAISEADQVTGPFSFLIEIFLDEPGEMPVVLGFGQYQGKGWFLQRFGGRWRFHLSGVSCDGGEATVGEWARVVGVFDGRTARLYQNGRLIAEANIPRLPQPIARELFVGQYSAQQEPAFQMAGRIRRLEVYARSLEEDER